MDDTAGTQQASTRPLNPDEVSTRVFGMIRDLALELHPNWD